MQNEIRVGVVGVGYLGKFHAKIYSKLPGAKLVGVVDTDPEAAERVAQEYGCAVFSSIDDLAEQIDAVSVVVPTVYHLDVARPFLERGIHMLLEKPIAPDLEQGVQIVELAEKHDAMLQIGHLERYNAGVMALAQRIQKPRFIEVHRVGGFVARATDVDVVTDLMIHDIDIVMSLVKSPISRIAGEGMNVITDHIDIANARLEFENGAVANINASRVSNKQLRRIRVFEDHRYEALNYTDQQIETIKPVSSNGSNGWPEIQREEIQIEPQQPLDAELADFLDKIRNGGEPLVSGRIGLEALKVVLEVKEMILR